jgi:hypothetical protein
VWLLILRRCFLFLRYKRNNPLRRCFYLICGIVAVSPVVRLVVSPWMVIMFLMLFLTGILTTVLYFTRLRRYHYRYIPGSAVLLLGLVLLYPLVLPLLGVDSLGVLFTPEAFCLAITLVLCVCSLVLFSSYMLRHCRAMRSM